jgi:MFS transporter, DHA1 family, inner membrane transport protein
MHRLTAPWRGGRAGFRLTLLTVGVECTHTTAPIPHVDGVPVDLDTALAPAPDTVLVHGAAAIPAVPAVPVAAGRDRVLPALCLGSFVATLTFVAPAPLFPDMAADLGVGVPLLGQFVTGMMLLSAPLALVTGPLADRYGHRRLILVGLVAASACLFTLGFAPVFAVLLVACLFGALADATVPGLSLAVAGTHFPGAAGRRAIGWTIGSLASAGIIGVPIVAAISQAFGWRAAFLGAGVLAIGVRVLAGRWLPDDAKRGDGSFRLGDIADAYRPLLHDRAMLRLYGASVLRAICWLGLLTYFGAFLDDELGLGVGQVGLVYMLGGSGYLLGSLLAGGPLGRVPPRLLIAVANIAMAASMGLSFSMVFGTAGTVALFPLVGLTGAVGWVGLAALLTAETPAGSGATMTLSGALFNLGAAGGAAIGGLLLALGGYAALALGLPLFAVAAAALVWCR